MLALLKGLLAADPAHRLGARAALALPAFDILRGEAWKINSPKKLTDVEEEETDVNEAEEGMIERSIKSLEKRSICPRGMKGSQSDANSIRNEGHDNESVGKPAGPDLYKKSLLKRMASNNISSPTGQHPPIGAHGRQESVGSWGSQASGEEHHKGPLASPLGSKKISFSSSGNEKPSTSTRQISLFGTKNLSRSGMGDSFAK